VTQVRVSSFEPALQHTNRADQVESDVQMVVAKPMTIGQLARRTGVPIKALREYEQLGLLYTLGRSESNYRLFDEEALWCVQVIRAMRSLGLTLKEIQDLTAPYLERPGEPIGPHLGEKLEAALTRIEARITDLQALRQRIRDFQSAHAAELAGETELDLLASDPRRTLSKSPS
jgi:MerR family copper efflux transcriptional regulator